ncbi:MAG: hypothetical protein ACR2KV_13545 [Solirubrobacteraceae bacterium]
MQRRLLTASAVAAVLAFGAATASAATTIVGSTSESSAQGTNSTQSGANGSGGGSTFILEDASPTTFQDSTNVLADGQAIGGGGGVTTLIAPAAGECFCQSSAQGVNSQQTGVNGDGGGSGTTLVVAGDSLGLLDQSSANVLTNVVILGG